MSEQENNSSVILNAEHSLGANSRRTCRLALGPRQGEIGISQLNGLASGLVAEDTQKTPPAPGRKACMKHPGTAGLALCGMNTGENWPQGSSLL